MYIPKSNIVETGYTQGTEYLIAATQLSYKGYYFKDKQGNYWSGKESSSSSIQLRPIYTQQTTNPANSLVNASYTKAYGKSIQTESFNNDFIQPTADDYAKGYFIRYIAKFISASQPIFIEVNKDHYDKIIQNTTLSLVYPTVPLFWKLTGPIDDAFSGNIRVAVGVRDANLRSIQEAEKIIKGVSSFLTDPLQFRES